MNIPRWPIGSRVRLKSGSFPGVLVVVGPPPEGRVADSNWTVATPEGQGWGHIGAPAEAFEGVLPGETR